MKDILQDKEIIQWINENPNFSNEKQWGNEKLKMYCGTQKNTNQWTTKLGEKIIEHILIRRGMNPRKIKKKKINGIGYKPDIETKEAIWEIKTRNYSTPGTAGEKIFGTIWKYSSIPKIFKKPLIIVLLAYQEEEAIKKFKIFDNNLPPERKIFIQMMQNIGIYFMKATDLLNKKTFTVPLLKSL